MAGNIDVGENTENALAAGAVTQVKAGSQITVTIHQVNADGAGPYVCDLDETSNANVISHNLTVTNNVPGSNGLSQAKEQDFNITVTMPTDMNCIGASTGNICTVRCRNNALAGPFGGCFAVQQIDVAATVNTPENIQTGITLDEVNSQVLQDQADLPAALAANAKAGSTEAEQNLAAVNALIGVSVTSKSAAIETPIVNTSGVTAAAATNGVSTAAADTTTTSATTAATSTKAATKGTKNKNKGTDVNNEVQRRESHSGSSGLRWARRMVNNGVADA
ncbi:hypothetical protein SBRCBS47491_009079 [Sporothrix bragantina]|uniref:Gas1-like protein n=1 Tax=Sporothrix bragantina TaxID=671064 RepID=A0ABP0CRQ8_9PEZI